MTMYVDCCFLYGRRDAGLSDWYSIFAGCGGVCEKQCVLDSTDKLRAQARTMSVRACGDSGMEIRRS